MCVGNRIQSEHIFEKCYRIETSEALYLNKKGDSLKIRGSWAEVEDKFVFMASKIKKGDYFELKVRLTKDGTPFWTMSPEELEREKAE